MTPERPHEIVTPFSAVVEWDVRCTASGGLEALAA